jgi:hypothetical protein
MKNLSMPQRRIYCKLRRNPNKFFLSWFIYYFEYSQIQNGILWFEIIFSKNLESIILVFVFYWYFINIQVIYQRHNWNFYFQNFTQVIKYYSRNFLAVEKYFDDYLNKYLSFSSYLSTKQWLDIVISNNFIYWHIWVSHIFSFQKYIFIIFGLLFKSYYSFIVKSLV